MPITIPHDLGAELTEASRWYPGEPEMEAFLAQVQAGHGWTPRRPRSLLRWADAHRIPVFGCKRFILMMNAGFDSPDRWRLWRTATAELRRAQAAIARGEESALAYAGNHDLLSFGEGLPRRWGATESVMQVTTYPSMAGTVPEPAGALPPSSPGSSAGPQVPRGGWLTR